MTDGNSVVSLCTVVCALLVIQSAAFLLTVFGSLDLPWSTSLPQLHSRRGDRLSVSSSHFACVVPQGERFLLSVLADH